jgi:hypothetical protein
LNIPIATLGLVCLSKERDIFRARPSAVSVRQNLSVLKIDERFMGQKLCIVCDALSPISQTGINVIKYLSNVVIQLTILMFIQSVQFELDINAHTERGFSDQ